MTTNIFRIMPAVFFFGLGVLLHAQTARFFWEGGENASRYEVEIEIRQGSGYANYELKSVTEKVFVLTLPPGRYRFRVTPYDILGRQGSVSDWMYFEVPERAAVTSAEPEPEPVSEPEEEFYHEPNGQDEKEKERERKPRNFIVNIGAAFMPVFPAYKENQEAQFFGAALRASVNFPVLETVYAGPEAAISITLNQFTAGLNARIFKSMDSSNSGFVFRAGAEYAIPLDNRVITNPINLTAGVSFVWQITPLVNAEIGIDFSSSINIPPDGNIRPWLGAGVRF